MSFSTELQDRPGSERISSSSFQAAESASLIPNTYALPKSGVTDAPQSAQPDDRPDETPVDQQKSAMNNLIIGGLWCVGGTIATIVSYSSVSDRGGSYFIYWGAIVFGGIQCLKGLFGLMSGE